MVSPVSSPSPLPQAPDRRSRDYLILCGAVAVILAGLVVYSQIRAFSWDAGFHLLAARLIREGKRPYLDFCFPQTPLNAYLNVAWMRIFGETWRSAQALAAILTAGAIWLTADFVYMRFPVPEWKLPAAVFSAILCASIYNVVAYGPVAQAYGSSLFLIVAALRLAMAAVRRGSVALILLAGLCAGTSTGCTLLTAAAAPVILLWCVFENKAAGRTKTAAAFVAGSIIPLIPIAWLAVEGPRQVLFNLVQYQTLYRRVKWEGASEHDFEVFFSVSGTPAALLLILLAFTGLWLVTRHPEWKGVWDRALRSELYVSTAAALAISAEVATAHPTFERYFLLATPFLALPAAVGLFVVGTKLYRADHPWRVVAAASSLALFGLAGQLYNEREALTWRGLQQVAAKVNEVTPPGAPVFLDEPTFFLTRRPLPDGMEFSHAYKLELPPAQGTLLHIMPQSKIDEMVAQKQFATVETCDDDEVDRLKLNTIYSEHATVKTCDVFWHVK